MNKVVIKQSCDVKNQKWPFFPKVNWSHRLSEKLVAFWPLNEGRGRQNLGLSYKNRNNHKMTVGSAGVVPSWSRPPFNPKLAQGMKKALNFPGGTAGYTQRTLDGNLANVSPMTVSAWIYPDGPGASDDFIYSRDVRKIFRLTTGNALQLFVDFATVNLSVQSNDSEVINSKWQYVATTWDGSATAATGVKLFIDGHEVSGYVAQTDGTGGVVSDAGGSLVTRIGNAANEQNGFDGYIANVKLWKKSLTRAEILADFENPWAIIDNFSRVFYLGIAAAQPGGGGSTATPAIARITVLVNAPTTKISASALASPALATVKIIIGSPTVSSGAAATASPAVAVVTIQVNAPTLKITRSASAAPSIASVTVLINSPTVKITRSAQAAPALAGVTVLIFSPTVLVGGSAIAQPSLAVVRIVVGASTASVPSAGAQITITINLKSQIEKQWNTKSRIEKYLNMESSLVN